VLTIESKFTEPLDGCGQLKANERTFIVEGRPTRRRGAACSGNYEPGPDLTGKTAAPCRLMVPEGRREARRYWDLAPRLFEQGCIEAPQRSCPFARTYQLMRNLSFAAAWAAREGRPDFGFVLVSVGAASNAAKSEALFEAFREMLLPSVRSASARSGTSESPRCSALLGVWRMSGSPHGSKAASPMAPPPGLGSNPAWATRGSGCQRQFKTELGTVSYVGVNTP
jgi:hypothetical protein